MRSKEAQRRIKKLFDADQGDRAAVSLKRFSDKERLQLIGKRDQRRIRILSNILKAKPLLRGVDYFRAGFIFQHGRTIALIKKAKQAARKSFELGYEPGRWLYAAATDRMLMMQGKEQRFGTQFRRKERRWALHPVRLHTSDAERREYNVLPLQKIRKMVVFLNRKSRRSGVPKAKMGLTRLR